MKGEKGRKEGKGEREEREQWRYLINLRNAIDTLLSLSLFHLFPDQILLPV